MLSLVFNFWHDRRRQKKIKAGGKEESEWEKTRGRELMNIKNDYITLSDFRG